MADERDEQATAVHKTQPESGRADVFYSRDEAQRQDEAPTPPVAGPESTSATSPAAADRIAADREDPFAEKPHVYALGAFAGAFVFAQILKRLTGGDD